MKPGLAALLAPESTWRFFEEAWPDEPFLVRGPPSRLKGLVDVKELASADSLAQVECRAVLAQSQRLVDRFGNVAIAPQLARAMVEAGFTLYFNEPHFPSRSLWRWVRALEDDLALPRGAMRPSAFFSARGKGARMHFDNTESFVVQVRGKKVWRIARNDAVPYPPVNYLEGDPLPPELAPLAKRPLQAPKKSRRVVLEPGSVLFLPRGWWHATETLEDSLHLDLLMAAPTWADVLRAEVDAVFARAAHWRTPATAPQFREVMEAQLLDDLREAFARRR
ncbi:MAG: cupin domain-containing protein [Myxococcota bacterium]